MNYTKKSFKGQFKQALRLDTKYLLILGDEEFNRGMVSIKDTKTEVQEEIKLNEVVNYLTQKLEK
jgi:histidyl-tRNA synthetase